MKKSQLTKTLLLGLAVVGAPLYSMAETEAAAAAPAQEQSDKMWYNVGWIVSQSALQFELTEQERVPFLAGFTAGLEGKEGVGNDPAAMAALSDFLQQRAEKQRAAFFEELAAKNKAYFDELKNDPEVKKTESGLLYKVTKPGSDKKATGSDRVRAHYRGTLTNGVVFDESFERGVPADFRLDGELIPGFAEGLQLVGEGGEVTLYIPGNLAYGDKSLEETGFPPNTPLIFDIVLEAVNPETPSPMAIPGMPVPAAQ